MWAVLRVFTERSEVPLVTLNLCIMRRYNLGEGTWYPQLSDLFLSTVSNNDLFNVVTNPIDVNLIDVHRSSTATHYNSDVSGCLIGQHTPTYSFAPCARPRSQ